MFKTKSTYYSNGINGKPAYVSISGEGENKDSWKATEIKIGDTVENAKCLKNPQSYTLTDCDNIFTTISSMFPGISFEENDDGKEEERKCDCDKDDHTCHCHKDEKGESCDCQKVNKPTTPPSTKCSKPNRLKAIVDALYDDKKAGGGITIEKEPKSIKIEDKASDFKKPEPKEIIESKIPTKTELTADEKMLAFQGSFTKALYADIIQDLERDLGVKLDYINILTLSLGSVLVQLTPITKNPHNSGIKLVKNLSTMKYWYGKKYPAFKSWFDNIQYWSNYDKDNLICGIQFNYIENVY